MTKVVTLANLKGGVGKTTNTCMTAYALAEKGYRVLIVDKDPQANVTAFFISTMEQRGETVPNLEDKFLLNGINAGSLKNCIIPVMKNLDMIPTSPRFQYYPYTLERMFKGSSDAVELQRITYFSSLLEGIKENYDYIFIDVPPTISKFTDAALYATDYVVIILQTHQRALQGAEIFVEYLNDIIVSRFGHRLEIAGVLAVILKQDSQVDQATLVNAENTFGLENMFKTQIKQMERLKRYDITGITSDNNHDKRVLEIYKGLAEELLNRIDSMEGAKQV